MGTLGLQTKGMFDQLNSELFVTDAKGRIVFTNKFLRQTKGISEKDALGKKAREVWGGNMSQAFYNELWDTIGNKKSVFTAEIVNYNQGKKRKEGLNIIPLTDEKNNVEYFMQITPSLHSKPANQHFSEEIKDRKLGSHSTSQDFYDFLSYWDQFSGTGRQFDFKFRPLLTLIESLFYGDNDFSKVEDNHIAEFSKIDSREFAFFYDKYFSYVYRYLAKRMNSAAQAEEMAQEVFYRAFTHLASFSLQDCTYLNYLMMIAHNLLVNHYRHFRPVYPLEAAYKKAVAPQFVERLKQEEVWDYVKQLSDIDAEVIRLFYENAYSVAEIAKFIGKSENAVKLILSRARKKLKDKLQILGI